MEYWRIEQGWKSALEGMLHLMMNKEALSVEGQDKLNIAVKDWWYAAPEEKKKKIIELMDYINSLPRVKSKKGLFRRK